MKLVRDSDVLVIGAGPVGLFAALSLAERGLSVQVVDKDWRGAGHSYALALHPESLRLMDAYGAADPLLGQGHRVDRLTLYGGDERLGAIELSALSGTFPFVLVVPQSALEQALERRLREHGVKIAWNHQLLDFLQDAGGVTARIATLDKYVTGYPVARSEWMVTREQEVRSAFLVGADGYHSQTRKTLGSRFAHLGPAEAFSVYEFPGQLQFQHESRIVFADETVNVVWPLGQRRGRWSFQVEADDPPPAELDTARELIRNRAPWFRTEIDEILWATTVLFERRLAERFGHGRVWLAGDAAHITGPIGAQSMNVGLREAHDLAERFSAVLKGGGTAHGLEVYEKQRQQEWGQLLGNVRLGDGAPAWASEHAARILPCMPASGEDLATLLRLAGLTPAPAVDSPAG